MIVADDLTFEVVRRPGPRTPARYRLFFKNNSSQILESQIEGDARASGAGIVEHLSFSLTLPAGGERVEELELSKDHDAFDFVFAYRPEPRAAMKVHTGLKIRNAAG